MDYLTDLWANADSIVVVSALFMTLSGLAVVLRFATKPFIKQGIKLDDGFIVLGLLFYYAEEIFQLKAVLIGRTSTSVADPNFVQYFKWLYWDGVWYFLSLASINISILTLYLRLFATTKGPKGSAFRKAALALIIFFAGWGIAGTIGEVLICLPISSNWDFSVKKTRCENYPAFFFFFLISEVIAEILTLAMPIKEITKLKLDGRKKGQLCGIFLLGGFVIITAITRIPLTWNHSNISPVQDSLWLTIHIGTAILCACLPTYRPLVKKVVSILSSFKERYQSGSWRAVTSVSADNGAGGANGGGGGVRGQQSVEMETGYAGARIVEGGGGGGGGGGPDKGISNVNNVGNRYGALRDPSSEAVHLV